MAYNGVAVEVPASWAVVHTADPAACMSDNGPTLYVGGGDLPTCPVPVAASPVGIVQLQPLSSSPLAASPRQGARVTVHGNVGYDLKGPRLVSFPALNLLVTLDTTDQAIGRTILGSLRRVGPIPPPAPAPPVSTVLADGLFSATAGWARTDRGLFVTSNGGATWTDRTPTGVDAADISGVAFPTPDRVWVSVGVAPNPRTGGGTAPAEVIYRSGDGGRTWARSELPLPGQAAYDTDFVAWSQVDLDVLDASHGWLVAPLATNTTRSEAVLYRTIDGGRTWTLGTIPVAGSVTFATPLRGWTSGGTGSHVQLYVTNDGGRSWKPQPWSAAPPGDYPPAVFGPQHDVLAVQVENTDGTAGTLTFYTGTGAEPAWQPIATLPTHQLTGDVEILDPTTWVVSADPYLYTTTDAGRTWTHLLTAPRLPQPSLDMIDPEHGWARQPGCPQSFSCPGGALLTTSDGGRTWAPPTPTS